MGLTEFLLARIAEDEERQETWHVGHREECIYEGGYGGTTRCDCGAVERHQRDCEGRRWLIERVGHPAWDGFRYLAWAYADHPDYRDEWRP